MTTQALKRRLDRLAPQASTKWQTPSPLDQNALDSVRAYLAGSPKKAPGVSKAVYEAMLEFLAGNGPPAPR